ncbi:MAG: hypothetical protein ACTHXJ_03510, partial [Mesonia sp.]
MNRRGTHKALQNVGRKSVLIFFICLMAMAPKILAQEVSSGIDSTSIQIGAQIKYKIQVETDTTNLVVFPEG